MTARGILARSPTRDRKSTRLNSSHEWISYAVFCLKKKKTHSKLSHTANDNTKHTHTQCFYQWQAFTPTACFFIRAAVTPSEAFTFFFNDTATTEIYTLSLHDALPI